MTDEDQRHTPDQFVFVQPGTAEADALCFLYANDDYGFKAAEVRDNTSIPNDSAYKALTRLKEKDLIGETTDGYYHALDDPYVARYAESLRPGAAFQLDVGEDEYPDVIDLSTSGFPAADAAGDSLAVDGDADAGKEPFTEEGTHDEDS